jgi:allophanate hydrolase subunit 1
MKAPNLRLEVAGIDSLILRLFDVIDEANMPWMLAARTRLQDAFGEALIDLVPSYTTLLLHYDLCQLGQRAGASESGRGARRLAARRPARRPRAPVADLVRPQCRP